MRYLINIVIFSLFLQRHSVADNADFETNLYQRRPVIITEIFPRGRTDQPEWFELYNRSSVSVNLNNWYFGNNHDTVILTSSGYILSPGDFVVVTRRADLLKTKFPLLKKLIQPPRWQSMNNNSDTLFILDSTTALSDIVCYDSKWFTDWTVQSLERIDMNRSGMERSVWVPADRSTPGEPNRSIHWRRKKAGLDIGPVPFYPNGDGRDEFLNITIDLPVYQTVTITIYTFEGRAVMTYEGNRQSFLWDGRCAGGQRVKPGPFYVIAEFTSSSGRKNHIRKQGILWR